MSQIHRFYVPDLLDQHDVVQLSDDEHHHAFHVARIAAGDRVRLFNGEGSYADATVAASNKHELTIERGDLHRETEPATRLTLAQAWLNHSQSVENVVRRGTELGVDGFIFFRGEHSEKSPKAHDKWRKMAIESCKQCGRNRLPKFTCVNNVEACLERREGFVLVATQAVETKPLSGVLSGVNTAILIVGPEGDLTSHELDAVWAAGGHALSLGPLTLRSEVAATVAIALVQHHLGRLGPR